MIGTSEKSIEPRDSCDSSGDPENGRLPLFVPLLEPWMEGKTVGAEGRSARVAQSGSGHSKAINCYTDSLPRPSLTANTTRNYQNVPQFQCSFYYDWYWLAEIEKGQA